MKTLSPFYVSLLAATLLWGCKGKSNQNGSEAQSHEAVKVTTTAVVQDSITVTESFSASVESFVKNNIAPQSPNRIKTFHTEVGQTVRRGQLLVTLDNPQLSQLDLKMKKSKVDLDRIDELYRVGGISKSDWENARVAYDVDATSLRNLSENTRLTSPIAGVVTARNYDNGDMYTAQKPLLVVEQISPLKIRINISEKYFTQIHKGLPVKVMLDVFPGEVFNGTVGLIYPSVDPNTRTFTVEVHLKNTNQRVRPGMYATVEVNFGSKAALLVPDICVRTLPGSNERMVYLHQNGQAVLRKVKVGALVGSNYIIEEGLTPQDQVITSGINHLRNGINVEVVQQ